MSLIHSAPFGVIDSFYGKSFGVHSMKLHLGENVRTLVDATYGDPSKFNEIAKRLDSHIRMDGKDNPLVNDR